MSTRHARIADRATNEKNSKTLKALLQKTPNKYCADCKKKDARWASWNLGIFICIRCSGIHRSLGVHISKVKSVDLDTWVTDQVENMVRWGNERANKYWEANLKDRKPPEGNMEMWIRAKYEQKRWAMKGPIPDPSTLGGDDDDNDDKIQASPASSSAASSVRQSPAPQKQTQKQQSEFANLDAFLGSPSSSPSVKHQNVKPVSQLQGADFFFDNDTSTSNNTTQHTNSTMSSTKQNSTQKHDDLKSSILSLYSNMPAAMPSSQQQQQQQTMYGRNNFTSQMAGLNLGGNNNSTMWGSFISANSNQQQQQPQGSQFFSSSNTTTAAKPSEKKDVFADLLG
ncbi:uncharacterized protein BX663DRAFT_469486 [Cokeromyces recurvatus]|uniref:uncharacterized protein n=1 Tax=Cokeromyces recurvatus TaxID=90255 RepID=UPI00221E67FF|nr:uncharacterized protein BX663DRAFT_469486 [Cokeromyces recurvatus]KAI7904598.1 hypothetical protein BX663DRAFT_469486 [Cokeromyces recurvatus]